MPDKALLRQQMAALRTGKSAQQQRLAADAVARKLCKQALFKRAQHIGAYAAVAGEIDPWPLLVLANKLGKTTYLPVLAGKQMSFVRYNPRSTTLQNNRYGIPEPSYIGQISRPPTELDLVLVPLLAFDHRGRRLGMGGGFYDRTFAFKRRQSRHSKPTLLGLAHAAQQVSTIPADPWDVPLQGVVTDCHIWLR